MIKIGLVLSGGGARGIAHLGIVKALNEVGIYPDMLAGTSAGAIAGAMIAAGYSPDDVLDIVTKTNLLKYFRPALSRMGLLKIESAEGLFLQHLPKNSFESLHLPLTIAATDVLAGQTVFYNSGELIKPLLASCCLPGIFEPVRHDHKVLIDGGVLNNLPVEPLEGHCDFLIGVHVNPYGEKNNINSMRGVLQRSLYLAVNNHTRFKFSRFDFVIEPPQMNTFDIFDVKRAREIFVVGYRHAKSVRAELVKSLTLDAVQVSDET